jgi:hypothetical protein
MSEHEVMEEPHAPASSSSSSGAPRIVKPIAKRPDVDVDGDSPPIDTDSPSPPPEHEVMEEPHAPSPPPFQPPTVDQLLAQLDETAGTELPLPFKEVIGGMGLLWIGWIICRINDIPRGISPDSAYDGYVVPLYNELCAAEITSSQRSAIMATVCGAIITKICPPDSHNPENIRGTTGLILSIAYYSARTDSLNLRRQTVQPSSKDMCNWLWVQFLLQEFHCRPLGIS